MSNDSASASAAATAGGEYEFQASEEGVVRDLAGTMRMASMAAMLLGLLSLGVGGLRLWGGHILGGIEGLGTALVAILASMWVRTAAKSFQLVVDTKGNDMKNTLSAMTVLRRMFMLGVVACVALIALLIGGNVSGFMVHRSHQQPAAAAAPAAN